MTVEHMAKNNLYAYATGRDFSIIASSIVERVNEFISSRPWVCSDVWAVNQQRTPEDWELGLNLSMPDPYKEPPGWYADVEAVVAFCCKLRRDFNQDFIIGITDNKSGCSEDIIDIESDQPNYEYLRKFIGVEPPTAGNDKSSS